MSSPVSHVAVFGPGLMGASLLMALRARAPRTKLSAWARREAAAQEVGQLGLADESTIDTAAAMRGADTVVLCVPVDRLEEVARAIAPQVGADTLVTDVGSTKGNIVARLEKIFARHRNFVGSHPMCGSEASGLGAARASLYEGALCVVCRTEDTRADFAERAEELWRSVGGRVAFMTPQEHDAAAAVASHVPHVAAAALVDLAAQEPENFRALCATGFRDTTRIASGSPELWAAILADNADHTAAALEKLEHLLAGYRQCLRQGDRAEIATRLASAASNRAKIFAHR